MKGYIDMSAVTDNDNDKIITAKKAMLRFRIYLVLEKMLNYLQLVKNKTRSGGALFPIFK